jgi:hypothetical protein
MDGGELAFMELGPLVRMVAPGPSKSIKVDGGREGGQPANLHTWSFRVLPMASTRSGSTTSISTRAFARVVAAFHAVR